MKVESVQVLEVGSELTGAHSLVRLIVAAAVSAIDLALWDLKGKALELPVWELLGGRTRDRIRLHVLVGGGTPDEIVSSVNWAAEEGFTAAEFDPLAHGYQDLSTQRLVTSACAMAVTAREAGGDEIHLIFELHRKLDPTKAIVVCNALAQFHPLFIEDPIQLDSIDTQAEIASRIAAPIATGERLSSIPEFNAPTLHLCATIPNLVAMAYVPLDEDMSSASAAFTTAVARNGGYCEIPDAPGLGISLVDDHQRVAPVIERALTDAELLRADGSIATANWDMDMVALLGDLAKALGS